MQPVQLQDGTQLDPKVLKVVRALREVESGGDYNAIGDGGNAFGAYQYNEKTGPGWKNLAKQYLGDENAPMDRANQNKVTYYRVKQWKDEGKQPEEIAALWNGAKKDPNTGMYTYVRPEYGVKFRDALTKQTPEYQTEATFVNKPENIGSNLNPEVGEGLASKLTERAGKASEALSKTATGQINPLSGILQTVGAGAGAITDVAGSAVSAITPDFIEKPVMGAIEKGVGKVANTEIGKGLIKKGTEFAQQHPELAGNIGAVGNILGAYGVLSGAGALKRGVTSAVGKATGKRAIEATVADVSPQLSTRGLAKTIAKSGTTKSPVTGEIGVVASKNIDDIARTVEEVVPNFQKMNTYSDKVNAVRDGVSKLAKDLRSNLKGEIEPLLTPDDLLLIEKKMATEIAQNPLLVGDSAQTAQRIYDQFKRLLPQDRIPTMTDVLDARQQLDDWIEAIKGSGVFDPKTENALSVSLRAVRQGANDILEARVPEGNIKQLLRKQSQLYRAIENMSVKATKEVGSTRVSRFGSRHPIIKGLVNRVKNSIIPAAETAAGIRLLSE